jgi:hypothetical protein
MLTTKEIQDHVSKISYKPGWAFEVYDGEWEGQHFVITTVVPDAYNLTETVTLDVHSMLPPIPDKNYLNQWIMWRLARIEVHEMREFFRVDGKIVDDPHAEFASRDKGSMVNG